MFGRLFHNQKKQVVLYGAAAHACVPDMAGVRVQRIHTLNWRHIAAASIRDGGRHVPAHIKRAERILRRDMKGKAPLYFISMTGDPLAQALAHIFRPFFESASVRDVAHALCDAGAAHDLVRLYSDWFGREFQPATGIDICQEAFTGHAIYRQGHHQFLVLDGTLAGDVQARIISDFIGVDVPPPTPREAADATYQAFEDAFLHCVLRGDASPDFYDTRAVLHMYGAARAEAFASAMRARARPLRFDSPPQDARATAIMRGMATLARRKGGIHAPLDLLRQAGIHDALTASLTSEAALLADGFAFSARRDVPVYAPEANCVLYTPHQCLPYHGSGYATRTHGLVQALAAQGVRVHIQARAGYPADTGVRAAHGAQAEVDGVTYHFDTRAGAGKQDLPLADYIASGADYLVAQAEGVRPAILHSASNYICGLAGIEAARRLGIPSVYEMRGLWHVTQCAKDADYAHTDKFALAQRLELQCAQTADHVLVITAALGEWLTENGVDAAKISLAPNAVDADMFAPAPYDAEFAAEAGCAGKTVIGYIGSFTDYEGLDVLVQAVSLLPEDIRVQICLLWVGDGPALDGLLTLAQRLGVREHIVSLGRRPFGDMPRAYSVVDIAAFPRKGLMVCEIISPLKPFEAMAMEKAVLVSSVRPLAEIISHGLTGLVHTKNDAHDLSLKLAQLITDADLRKTLGAQARAWILQTRQWDAIARSVTDVYGGLA